MARAIALARRGWYSSPPNPRVGCVLVANGAVVGEGWHARTGGPHAEVEALRAAGERAAGATAYVSLEPCGHHGRTPPCAAALIEAGVARVVIGMRDPNPQVAGAGVAALAAAGVAVTEGVLAAECAALNPGFVSRMRRGRPRVRVKLAASLDGRTAGADGASQWITGPAARADVHRLRAESGAVLTGIGTALADDPALTVRLPGDWRQPLRVVLDSALRLAPEARLLARPEGSLILTRQDQGTAWERLAGAGAQIQRVAAGAQDLRLDLAAVLRVLAEREVNDVLVEAGATLAGAFIAAGLADEIVCYLAPTLIGADGAPLLCLPGVSRFDQRVGLSITDVRAVGRDWRITAVPPASG